MKLGDTIIIQKECVEKVCFECNEPAFKRHTFLYENSRNNPASSGYGKDDISWCSDDEAFACIKHDDVVRKEHCPRDMKWCSTFTRHERFEHMFLEWKETKLDFTTPLTQLPSMKDTEDFLRQFQKESEKV